MYVFQNFPKCMFKKETPTCFNFDIFDHDLQLDIKFLNP